MSHGTYIRWKLNELHNTHHTLRIFRIQSFHLIGWNFQKSCVFQILIHSSLLLSTLGVLFRFDAFILGVHQPIFNAISIHDLLQLSDYAVEPKSQLKTRTKLPPPKKINTVHNLITFSIIFKNKDWGFGRLNPPPPIKTSVN